MHHLDATPLISLPLLFGRALGLTVRGLMNRRIKDGVCRSLFVCFTIGVTNLFPLRRRRQQGKLGRERMGLERRGDVFKGLVVIIVGRMGARGWSFPKESGIR